MSERLIRRFVVRALEADMKEFVRRLGDMAAERMWGDHLYRPLAEIGK